MNLAHCDKCHLTLIMEEVKDHICKYKFEELKFIDNVMWAYNEENWHPVRLIDSERKKIIREHPKMLQNL